MSVWIKTVTTTGEWGTCSVWRIPNRTKQRGEAAGCQNVLQWIDYISYSQCPTVEGIGMFTSFYRNFYVVFCTVTKLWNITKLCSIIYLFWLGGGGGGSFEWVEWDRTRLWWNSSDPVEWWFTFFFYFLIYPVNAVNICTELFWWCLTVWPLTVTLYALFL